MRMLIAGYCMGIRSERRLYEDVHLNLARRWLCRLGLKARAGPLDLLAASEPLDVGVRHSQLPNLGDGRHGHAA